MGLVTRPSWSDSTGKIELQKDHFIPPAGWKWEDPFDESAWEIRPELSVGFEPDDELNEWQEEIFEHQSRWAFRNWPAQMIDSTWVDSVLRSSCKCFQGTFLHIISVFCIVSSILI